MLTKFYSRVSAIIAAKGVFNFLHWNSKIGHVSVYIVY